MKKKIKPNLGLKLLALLIAICTWLVVVNVDDPISSKTYTGVQVQVTNADVVTDNDRTYQIVDDTSEVTVEIVAKRSILNKIKLDNIIATADMKELTLGTQIPIQVTIEGFEGRYESAESVPVNLQVEIDEAAKNTFPITPQTKGSVREGYMIHSLSADPEQITIRGPKQQIDSISKVVALADVAGLSDSGEVEASLILYDANDNVIDQTLLENNLGEEGVSVNVEMYKVKTVDVTLDTSEIIPADGYTISDVLVEPKTLSITGSKDILDSISEISIPSSAVAMTEVNKKEEITVDVTPYLPEGTSIYEDNTTNVVVTVSVQAPDAKTYEVSTSSISLDNLDSGLQVSFGKIVDLEIQIQGPSDILDTLSLTQRVSMDFSKYTSAGTYKVPVDVDLPDDCSLKNKVYANITIEKKDSSE